ncbi:MAG: hypothetical protein DRQ49_18405 [Gammaproteobacteria bacterium]|nr:MAG: hypothetical protein DRQ49_18405 [Gammaproteobacteria bacterium]
MDESNINKELKAIETITKTLADLDKAAQQRVLQYSMQHLDLHVEHFNQLPAIPPEKKGEQAKQSMQHLQQLPVDIRSLSDQKQPNSDMEMAAIVAYYLSEVAPEDERKDSIVTKDIKKYFKQAGYPLPGGPQFTLPNAKAAGYFESAGHGKYKLNPVGYNLVVHGLPRAKSESSSQPTRRKTKKKKIEKSSKKKTPKKAR